MSNFIEQTIQSLGYIGIFLLIALENIFPPIPSEVILSFSGFMTARTQLSIVGALLCATLGSLVGALILYAIGRALGFKGVYGFCERFKRLKIKKEYLDRAFRAYENRQNSAVFLCRMMPIVRSLISLPAGASKMRLDNFLILTAAGSLIWNAVLILLGAFLGENWQKAVDAFGVYSWIFYALLAISLICLIIILIKRKKKKGE